MSQHTWVKHPTSKHNVEKMAQCSRCKSVRRWSTLGARYEYYDVLKGHIGNRPGKCVK